MSEWLIPILVVISVPAAIIAINQPKVFRLCHLILNSSTFKWISRLKSSLFYNVQSVKSLDTATKPDIGSLDSRVRLARERQDNCTIDVFIVDVCGTIEAPDDIKNVTLQVSIVDVTEGIINAAPVHSRLRQFQMSDSPEFVYNADLGKLTGQAITLSDWMSVAQLRFDWLILPRKGKRNLQFKVLLLSQLGDKQIGCVESTFIYENEEFGYLDLQENIQRARTLTVALGFIVSAADGKMFNCEIELIKDWARHNICSNRSSEKALNKLEKALDTTVAFFRDGNSLDAYQMCKEILEITSVGQRYDILELCLRVAGAKGTVNSEEIILLKNLADWFEVDTERFRSLIERILPVNMYEIKDAEVIFGVTSEMGRETARKRLNKEYAKWSSRVTNTDPQVQAQADQMLELIAEARGKFVGLDTSI